MSSGANCQIIEVKRDKWYYLLERDPDSDSGDDWREDANCHGPFSSPDAATEHLDRNYANPGDWWETPLPKGQDEVDLSQDATLAAAIARASRSASGMRGGQGFSTRSRMRGG